MHTQLFAVSVTSQFVNAFSELALPVLLRKVAEWREERSSSSSTRTPLRQGSTDSSSSGETTPARRSQNVVSSPAYARNSSCHPTTSSATTPRWPPSSATSFSGRFVWPLSPVMGFVNNFFELRSDAAKISVNNRRPVPVRAETIGAWLETFGFIAWAGALNNAALVYLFQQSDEALLEGHSTYETRLRSHIHPSSGFANSTLAGGQEGQSWLSFTRVLPSNIPTSGPAGAIVAAVLVALLAEHVYGLVRSGVRHVLERLIWRGSNEELVVRRRGMGVAGRDDEVARRGGVGPGKERGEDGRGGDGDGRRILEQEQGCWS